ncbi:MAG: phosphoenolpyruvate--protein phosphotransferase [Actinomycetota bacterium]|nr:phosphoenolpyruvate--protein phosphotransferase [Actinomycetota bacterium]
MPPPLGEPAEGARLEQKADREAAVVALETSTGTVGAELSARADAARQAGRGQAAEVLEATAMMATDPMLLGEAKTRIGQGSPPERALWDAAGQVAEQLSALGGYMAERVRDVQDVRDRVVAALTGRPAPGIPVRDEPFVLVARDLAPADTAALNPADVLALVTEQGGPTSHTAILARALGLPAVVAVAGATDLADGTWVLVDGAQGTIVIDPTAQERSTAARSQTPAALQAPGATSDGHRVGLYANVGDPSGIEAAVAAGAEGVGLFRTEFCFLDRAQAPSVNEQVTAYQRVLQAFPDRRVVVRTLDAGADKPLPFLTADDEPNPALGVRGLRTANRSPHVLQDQLSAIAHAAADSDTDVWVMAPMVATADEARAFTEQAHDAGLATAGVMVEIPSAALTADVLLKVSDFASLGTNDLAQYTMAADRQLGALAALNDPWQPALLRLVAMTAEAGTQSGRPVGVCGEAAADPLLACVLVGLGVTSLSMTPRALPAVGAQLAKVTLTRCAQLAEAALASESPTAARDCVASILNQSP